MMKSVEIVPTRVIFLILSLGNVLLCSGNAQDFNGDGFRDLTVGVPREDVGNRRDAGMVHVLYGSSTGLQATGTGGPDDQLWHQDRAGVTDIAEEDDHFGATLCWGDFNGDGFDDLAVGIPNEDVDTVLDAGAVQVLYGSPTGLQAKGEGGPNDQLWHQNRVGVVDTAEEGDLFGYTLACCDFNGDGFDDLAVEVVGENIGTISDAGAVHILYGSSTGLQATGTGGPDDQLWHQDSSGVADTAEVGDLFGYALGCCDFNGDGFDDLAVGIPNEDAGTVSDAGAVHILYGSSTGLQATGTGGPDDQLWHQDGVDVLDTAEEFDVFGSALTCCDFNGDGFDDLAVGVPGEEVSIITNMGAVHVFYGSSTGLQATAPDDQLWHQDSPDVEETAESADAFGFALACCDFNGDGFDDLAVGVPDENLVVGDVNLVAAGAVHVLYGSSTGLQATGTGGPDDQLWHQDNPGVADTVEEGDMFGFTLVCGDYNNDGFDDLAVGVHLENFPMISNAGAVNVLYGSISGLTATGSQFWHQDAPSVKDIAETNDQFGRLQ